MILRLSSEKLESSFVILKPLISLGEYMKKLLSILSGALIFTSCSGGSDSPSNGSLGGNIGQMNSLVIGQQYTQTVCKNDTQQNESRKRFYVRIGRDTFVYDEDLFAGLGCSGVRFQTTKVVWTVKSISPLASDNTYDDQLTAIVSVSVIPRTTEHADDRNMINDKGFTDWTVDVAKNITCLLTPGQPENVRVPCAGKIFNLNFKLLNLGFVHDNTTYQ